MSKYGSRAARLRTPVTIQRPTKSPDGMGGWTESWATVATVSAQVRDLRMEEVVQQMALQSRITHSFTIRYRNDVDATCRIVLNSREYAIRGVVDMEERHAFLRIDAQVGAPV